MKQESTIQIKIPVFEAVESKGLVERATQEKMKRYEQSMMATGDRSPLLRNPISQEQQLNGRLGSKEEKEETREVMSPLLFTCSSCSSDAFGSFNSKGELPSSSSPAMPPQADPRRWRGSSTGEPMDQSSMATAATVRWTKCRPQ